MVAADLPTIDACLHTGTVGKMTLLGLVSAFPVENTALFKRSAHTCVSSY